ncbi:MAG TPA: methionyl-tRNA formyltransferase [Vampirovibrionales bacterium]
MDKPISQQSSNKLNQKLNVVFMGTPHFAIPSLKALINSDLIDVVLVITQPDKPAGRGKKIQKPPVKELAEQHNIEVQQPLKLKEDQNLINKLKELEPDLMITAAFGHIISQEIIDIPKWGIWNVHASLLPRWRGAAPINWSILKGDTKTGITIMQTEKGLDTGPILSKASTKITENDTAISLTQALAQIGANLLIQTIEQNIQAPIKAQIQNEEEATHAPKLTKELGAFNFPESTKEELSRKIRALQPWPGCNFTFRNQSIKVHEIKLVQEGSEEENLLKEKYIDNTKLEYLTIRNKKLYASCKNGFVELLIVQPPNKGKMDATAWFRGLKPTE